VGASSPKIVWSDLLDASFSRLLPDNVPDNIDQILYPVRRRDGPNVRGFANQVNDGPVVLSLLQVGGVQLNGLVPTKAAGDEYGYQRQVSFALHRLGVWTLKQCCHLIRQKPVPESDPDLLNAIAVQRFD